MCEVEETKKKQRSVTLHLHFRCEKLSFNSACNSTKRKGKLKERKAKHMSEPRRVATFLYFVEQLIFRYPAFDQFDIHSPPAPANQQKFPSPIRQISSLAATPTIAGSSSSSGGKKLVGLDGALFQQIVSNDFRECTTIQVGFATFLVYPLQLCGDRRKQQQALKLVVALSKVENDGDEIARYGQTLCNALLREETYYKYLTGEVARLAQEAVGPSSGTRDSSHYASTDSSSSSSQSSSDLSKVLMEFTDSLQGKYHRDILINGFVVLPHSHISGFARHRRQVAATLRYQQSPNTIVSFAGDRFDQGLQATYEELVGIKIARAAPLATMGRAIADISVRPVRLGDVCEALTELLLPELGAAAAELACHESVEFLRQFSCITLHTETVIFLRTFVPLLSPPTQCVSSGGTRSTFPAVHSAAVDYRHSSRGCVFGERCACCCAATAVDSTAAPSTCGGMQRHSGRVAARSAVVSVSLCEACSSAEDMQDGAVSPHPKPHDDAHAVARSLVLRMRQPSSSPSPFSSMAQLGTSSCFSSQIALDAAELPKPSASDKISTLPSNNAVIVPSAAAEWIAGNAAAVAAAVQARLASPECLLRTQAEADVVVVNSLGSGGSLAASYCPPQSRAPDVLVLTFAVNALAAILWFCSEMPTEQAAIRLGAFLTKCFYPTFVHFQSRAMQAGGGATLQLPGAVASNPLLDGCSLSAFRVCELLGVVSLMVPHLGKKMLRHNETLLVHEAVNTLSAVFTVGAAPQKISSAAAL